MSDDLKNQETEEVEEMDEIDKFLATLPSLHIPDDMVETDLPPQTGRARRSVSATSVFVLLAWAVFIFSLLWASRANPSHDWAFWGSATGKTVYNTGDPQALVNATWYLFGNCVVCLGGIAICAVKKMKMTSGSALNFWIAGGLSAIVGIVLLVVQ